MQELRIGSGKIAKPGSKVRIIPKCLSIIVCPVNNPCVNNTKFRAGFCEVHWPPCSQSEDI